MMGAKVTSATLKTCRTVAMVVLSEIAVATGATVTGDHKRPRFAGFRLTDDIRQRYDDAVELLRDGKLNEAQEQFAATLDHLKNKQVAYLRRQQTFNDLCSLIAGARGGGGVPSRLLESVREEIRGLEEYVLNSRFIGLQVASEKYWHIIDAVDKICTDWKKERGEKLAAEQAKIREAKEVAAHHFAEAAEDLRAGLEMLAV